MKNAVVVLNSDGNVLITHRTKQKGRELFIEKPRADGVLGEIGQNLLSLLAGEKRGPRPCRITSVISITRRISVWWEAEYEKRGPDSEL